MLSLINAGPGSGKTFTLVNGYLTLAKKLLVPVEPTEEQGAIFEFLQSEFNYNDSVCFFAHNNSTKETLEKRLMKEAKVFTFHGAGQSAIIDKWRFHKPDFRRTEKLIGTITGRELRDMSWSEKSEWYAIKRLVHYFKLENVEPSQAMYDYILKKYADMSAYRLPEDWLDRTVRLLELCAIPNNTVEYDDMLWLGAKAAKAKRPRYKIGFVDESQDISRCSYDLVTHMCEHVVFCGDKNQAINAFAGASEEMYDSIAQKCDAKLPLKMTLRNPPFICDMANTIRPGGVIKGPNTIDGEHKTITYASLPRELAEKCRPNNTLIISRTNAAVVGCAILLHKAGVEAQIVDRELSEEITNFIKSFKTTDLRKINDALNEYEAKAAKSKNPLWVQMCQDKAAYTRQLVNAVSTFTELLKLVKDTFEKYPKGFKLSSIHRSKGMEAKNVFILNPPVELEMAMNHPIAREQEINLHFVAITRSAKNLYWVSK